MNLLDVQKALRVRGYKGRNNLPLTLDGQAGINTTFAILAFQTDNGLQADGVAGPLTWAKLSAATNNPAPIPVYKAEAPPWYNIMLDQIGLHENRDHDKLVAWLKSDHATVGDPATIAWCGDAVQTALRLTLPTEKLPSNPYAAINWATWGKFVKPQLGCVLSFWRGSPSGWQGHVGFYAGESFENFYVLGGNQSDRISISPLSKTRLRKNGSRWPLIGPEPKNIVVKMSGGTVSTNET